MKPAPFEYHAPATVGDAAQMLSTLDDAKILAGGQSLVPMLALRLTQFAHLVDVTRVRGLGSVESVDGEVRIGSTVRQATFERDSSARSLAPLFARATPMIGHFQVRNRGTVGGSIAHADPAAEYPAIALALDASVELASAHDTRLVPASELFVATWTTTIADDEILTAIRFAPWGPRAGFGVHEIARRHGDFAIVGAVCGIEVDGARQISRAAVALFGVASTPVRARDTEDALIGQSLDTVELDGPSRLASTGLCPVTDVHATADYRRLVTPVVTRRALTAAIVDVKTALATDPTPADLGATR